MRQRPSRVLPGFRLTLFCTALYLLILVLVPISAVLLKSMSLPLDGWWKLLTNVRVLSALKISFGSALIAALANVFIGTLLAWVLVRYRLPGHRFWDALIDLPFALPTAVAGIALTAVYAPDGSIGRYLQTLGIEVTYTPLGIVVALLFIGLPFVVRTVQPVLTELDAGVEEAAASLGANHWQIFHRVVLPAIRPAILTGFALAFARGIGEYGSVIFIAGNMPKVSEIAPLLIYIKLEQYDYAGATAVATIMLLLSFALLLLINQQQRRLNRFQRK
ncbi:sulfate ABC transporter permease subunit CysT [Permianibacter sp. IMCC34836]|uniref:sulfate ABC transporter permease subunit CysT n=1 Tax=Permianibacter fluminis TaxID=2738515 RepID=UPI0015534C28|nr:sulfate ABC transporter permease subunit CysT [Permianibacter fluminis]NQD35872.1 sulfate ABC transporter permease subunit CysT [Permianibacter fluminis]